jgi:hypothetical protein
VTGEKWRLSGSREAIYFGMRMENTGQQEQERALD